MAEIELLVDRHRLATVDAPASSYDWDTTLVNDGEHAVTARVTDTNGRVAEGTTGAIVANATPGSVRLQIDHETGKLTDEEFALHAVDVALGGDAPEEYVTGSDEGIGATVLHAVSAINELDEATQQELVDQLTFRTADATPTSGAAISSTSSSGQCDDGPYGLGGMFADCYATFGDYTVYWRFGDFDESPSIPPEVERIGEALEQATSVYDDDNGLNFDRPFVPNVCVCHVAFGPAAFSVPQPIELVTDQFVAGHSASIVIDPDFGRIDPLDYVAAHELFHTYQYDFVGTLNLSLMSSQRRSDAFWWMEATAEWAAHQWAVDVGHPSAADQRKSYHESLAPYLDVGQEDIAGPIRSVPGTLTDFIFDVGHRYGGFIVAEWFHHDRGVQSIREIWQGVDLNTSPIESMSQVLPGGFDAADVGTLWRDLYFLDLAIPDRIDQAETDQYRQHLPSGGLFTEERMPRQHVDESELPYRDRIGIGRGGVKVYEFSASDQAPVTVEVTVEPGSTSALTAANVRLFPLANYDTHPDNTTAEGEIDLCVPPEPAEDIGDGYRIEVPADKQEPCEGYALIITNGSLAFGDLEFLDLTVRIHAGEATSAVLDNGTVQLGVHDGGELGVSAFEPSRTGSTRLQLRLKSRNAESLGHSSLGDGWGIRDERLGISGTAHPVDGLDNVQVRSTSWGPSTGVWRTRAGRLLVTHAYAPSSEDGLFRIFTMITNRAANPAANGGAGYASTAVTYRRSMDWEVPEFGTNLPFHEYVTIGSPTGMLPASVLHAVNEAFPLDPIDDPVPAAWDPAEGIFTDNGPAEQGALFDIYIPADELRFGDTVSFVQFYGAHPNEQDALDDLKAVGADLWSLGQPDTGDSLGPSLGKPNTFVWGYKELQTPRP